MDPPVSEVNVFDKKFIVVLVVLLLYDLFVICVVVLNCFVFFGSNVAPEFSIASLRFSQTTSVVYMLYVIYMLYKLYNSLK